MRTVADRLGLSVMTVSRVLRGDRRVAAATRERVLRCVGELGYRPNPMVSALMANLRSRSKGRTADTLAFLTSHAGPDPAHGTVRGGWQRGRTLSHFREGAEERARQLGFRVEDFPLNAPGMSEKRLGEILRARGVTGVVVGPLETPGRPLRLDWDGFASAAIGYSLAQPVLHRAVNHQIHSMRTAVSALTARGYRRIGLAIEKDNDQRADHNWLAGFLHYQYGISQTDRIPPLLPDVMTPKLVEEWLTRWRPDAILSGRYRLLDWLQGAGLRVPADIGFATLDYYPVLGPVAGISQNTRSVGVAAVELVVEQLYHNERGVPRKPKVVLIEGEWREGQTVRPDAKPTSSVPG